MQAINDFVSKVLELIPIEQKLLGYILIGVGVLILLMVAITLIAKMFKKNTNVSYQSKLEGARLSGPMTSMPQGGFRPNPSLNQSFSPGASPIRGSFAPKQPLVTLADPGEIGLSKLKSQVENVPITSPVEPSPVAARQIIPNTSQPANFQTFTQSKPPFGFDMSAQSPVQSMPTPQIKPKPVDPNLTDYIKKTKNLGYPNSAIRSELIKVGWNPIDVDQALSTNL